MRKPVALVLATLVVAGVVVAVVLSRSPESTDGAPRAATDGASSPDSARIAPSTSGLDPLVEEFRATERSCITRFNTALREQRENAIDELELSNTIERDVLTPWRELRVKVSSAPQTDELYTTLRRYLEARQLSWEAYVAALRSPTDDAARPHYDAHRQHNATAHEHAKHLGELFRAAANRGSGL